MKSVALYGFAATTRDQIHQSKADEIWSVNWAWQYDLPRIDRLFEIHSRWHLEYQGDKMIDHWEWLKQEHDFPIYMLEQFPDVPNCVVYPFEDVINNVGRQYFTSSVAYMIGLALLEGFGKIELYGIDMASATEYAYQKAGTEYLLGLAEGRGVKLYIPPEAQILRPTLYMCHGDFQVIGRQTLERILIEYSKQSDAARSAFEQAKGAYEHLKRVRDEIEDDVARSVLTEQVTQAYYETVKAKENALTPMVACQVLQHLIDTVDVKEVDYTIENSFAVSLQKG